MQLENVIKKIRSDSWWSEESPGNFQQAIPAWRAFVLQGNIYGKKYLTTCICLYENDFLYEKTSADEKLEQFYKVRDIYFKNPKQIIGYYKNFRKTIKLFLKLGEKFVREAPKMSDTDFANFYKVYYGAHIEFFTHSVMPEAMDIYSDQELKNDPEKNIVLSTYPMLSFMEVERVEFLKLCLSNKPSFEKFSQKY